MEDNKNKIIDLQEVRVGDQVSFQPIEEGPAVTAKKSKFNGRWWMTAGLLLIVVIAAVLLFTSQKSMDEPEVVAADVVQTEDQIYKATYVERELSYMGCGHVVTDLLHGDSRFVGKTFSQLEAEGWKVAKIGSNKVRIYRQVRGLCDADSKKRTLKLTGNGIGVYEGPKNVDGQLLSEMVMSTDQLPADIQNQLQAGGMEFADEDDLMETLESLDEYVGE